MVHSCPITENSGMKVSAMFYIYEDIIPLFESFILVSRKLYEISAAIILRSILERCVYMRWVLISDNNARMFWKILANDLYAIPYKLKMILSNNNRKWDDYDKRIGKRILDFFRECDFEILYRTYYAELSLYSHRHCVLPKGDSLFIDRLKKLNAILSMAVEIEALSYNIIHSWVKENKLYTYHDPPEHHDIDEDLYIKLTSDELMEEEIKIVEGGNSNERSS